MMNVQAAYEVCKDAAFVRHTTRDKYSRWEQGATMSLKDYMASRLTKYKTLKMKGQWEAPSPEQEQIIALSAAVSSLHAKAGRNTSKSDTGEDKRVTEGKEKGPRKNEGASTWKDVASKSGDPKSKSFNGKMYHWCVSHNHPQWTLHNPTAFPNLCKCHPEYAKMEAAWNASGKEGAGSTESSVMADDICLDSALVKINGSDSETDDYCLI
jgi:hypothetical protein